MSKPKKILFLWSRLPGYMAACWKALNLDPRIDLKIVLIDRFASDKSAPNFNTEILADVSHQAISLHQANKPEAISDLVDSYSPDLVVVGGWMFKGYVSLLKSAQHRDLPMVIASDNPYRGDLKQRVGYWRVRGLLKRANLVAVPGRRGKHLMQFWNVPEKKIMTGIYGINYQKLQHCLEQRRSKSWPRQFLFVGRMERRKGVDLLVEAYQKYRRSVSNPWSLRCVGKGPLESVVKATEGATLEPMVLPDDIPQEMKSAGAFVICSRYDCWPLVIAEACSAGLPVIASSACGSTDELLKHGSTGLLVDSPVTAEAITLQMQRLHQLDDDELFDWGSRSQMLAEHYSAQNWADRWSRKFLELTS